MANTSLDDIAKVDLLSDCGVDLVCLEGVLECDDTELGCGQTLECTVDGADGCSGGGDDDDFVLRLTPASAHVTTRTVVTHHCEVQGGRETAERGFGDE